MNDKKFDDWFKQVQNMALIFLNWPKETVETMDREAWREFFDDGYSPSEAWEEELHD